MCNSEKGAAFIELVLAMVLLLGLFFGIFVIGVSYQQSMRLENLLFHAGMAARAHCLNGTATQQESCLMLIRDNLTNFGNDIGLPVEGRLSSYRDNGSFQLVAETGPNLMSIDSANSPKFRTLTASLGTSCLVQVDLTAASFASVIPNTSQIKGELLC